MMDQLHKLDGRCHCGNIRYRYYSPVTTEDLTIRACRCSYCTKIGGRYTSDPQGILVAEVFDCEAIHLYRFATGTANFYVCGRCGMAPFVTCLLDDIMYALVNVNTLNDFCPIRAQIAYADFSHEDRETRLNRRRTKWIGNVTLTLPHGETMLGEEPVYSHETCHSLE